MTIYKYKRNNNQKQTPLKKEKKKKKRKKHSKEEQTFKSIRIDFRKKFSADVASDKAWMDDHFSQ